jgi:hypothetical protein
VKLEVQNDRSCAALSLMPCAFMAHKGAAVTCTVETVTAPPTFVYVKYWKIVKSTIKEASNKGILTLHNKMKTDFK